jgi:diadenosine tetraphosphate (Ap4A) HIT family hydrolase/5-methylcytosine-specific restriction endonuclease McrA
MSTLYEELSGFIEKKMRMAAIHQPVMLMSLLINDGKRSDALMARDLLLGDEIQMEYYTQMANNMVARGPGSQGIVKRNVLQKTFTLNRFEELSPRERKELISLCKTRIQDFRDKRDQEIEKKGGRSEKYISGILKFKILKRAKFHCELCGISADKRPLEVDYIGPKNGRDYTNNYQALCTQCNTMKRDKDKTDFRLIRESFDKKEENCDFCQIPDNRIIDENELAFVIRDNHPVVALHTLIILKRHEDNYFLLGQAEINSCTQLMKRARESIMNEDPRVKAFNIGINNGPLAGQTIQHCHIHLIPRRAGDVINPRGGIRNLMHEKGDHGNI